MKLPIFKLEEYLGEREFSTEIMFSGSDMESFSLQEILSMASEDSLKIWYDLRLSYTEPRGNPLLLHELNKRYQLRSALHNICVFSGAEEAIYAAFNTILNKDDHAIILTPCYQSLVDIPKYIGEVTEVKLKFLNGQCFFDMAEIEKSVRKNTKLLIINFPHNPSGALMSKEEQFFLIELARRHGFYIFSDEVYRGLEHDKENQLPSMASVYEKGISLGVMSKSYGLAGLRIGWLATQDSVLLKNLERMKYYLSICNSAPSEILALIALQNEEKIHSRNLDILKTNLKLLKLFFQDHSDVFEWYEPKGGCIAFPKLILKQNVYDFAENLRKNEGVLLLPGNIFDDENNHFRIGYGRLNMSEAIFRTKRFLKKGTLK
jgi:aspartate/methionine/tyrosine aminotransferase